MGNTPPLSVLNALRVSDRGQKLKGGQGTAFQYGNLVLKPCGNPIEWTGTANLLTSLNPVGYRITRPMRFPSGQWDVDGWIATEKLGGFPGFSGREREALGACDAIHCDIKKVNGLRTRPPSHNRLHTNLETGGIRNRNDARRWHCLGRKPTDERFSCKGAAHLRRYAALSVDLETRQLLR